MLQIYRPGNSKKMIPDSGKRSGPQTISAWEKNQIRDALFEVNLFRQRWGNEMDCRFAGNAVTGSGGKGSQVRQDRRRGEIHNR